MKVIDMIIKELKIAFSDRAVIIELIIMPIVLMTILGYSLTFSFNDTSSMEKVKIAIVKSYNIEEEKNSLLALIPADSNIDISTIDFEEFNMEKVFFEDFLGNKELSDIIEYQIMTEEEAFQKLDNKEITAVVNLPKGFIKDIMINFGTSFRNVVEIKVIGRTEKNIGTTIVEEVMRGYTEILNYNISSKNTFTKIYNRVGINEDISNHMENILDRIQAVLQTERTELEIEPLNNRPPMNSRAYYSFGMTAMFILFGAGYGSKLLLDEKKLGTYNRMSASGVKKSIVVFGKGFTIFLIAIIQMIITYVFSTIFLNVDWGSVVNLMLIFVATAFSIAGLGSMLGAIVSSVGSYNIVNLFTTFLIQIMAVLGGSMVPLEVMPSFARFASNFTLNGLMMKSLMKNYYGYGIWEFAVYLLILIALGIVFSVIAIYTLKNEGRRVNHVEHITAKADAI